MPRLRSSLRRLMLLVALCAGVALLVRWEMTYRRYRQWVEKGNMNPVEMSQQVDGLQDLVLEPGRPSPLRAKYSVALNKPLPPDGFRYAYTVNFWVEDQATGRAVHGIGAAGELVSGGRESASETFDWVPVVPGPGRYQIRQLVTVRAVSIEGAFSTSGNDSSFRVGVPVAVFPFCDEAGEHACKYRASVCEGF